MSISVSLGPSRILSHSIDNLSRYDKILPADRRPMKLFAVSTPGLEPFTSCELQGLGLSPLHPEGKDSDYESGGIELEGSLIDAYRSNLHLRTASRVLVRLGSFYATGFPELRKKAARLSWEEYLTDRRPVAVRVACHKSRLYHQRAIAERIIGAISDRIKCHVQVAKDTDEKDNFLSPPFGERELSESVKPPQLILVRLMSDHCTISIDSSGDLLHRRGYRLVTAKAPLRETLAAGMLLASGWDKASPLLDPFCGSGTIPIEAALMAGRIPPGYRRDFAFMDWPGFDRKTWESLLSEVPQTRREVLPRIMASDRDAGAIEAARANAERAGVSDMIDFSCRAVSSVDPPAGPGWVVTNPPYGVRTRGAKDLRNLYAQFGNVLRAKCPGWQVTMLCSSIQLLHSTGLELDQEISLMNGGIKVRLARAKVK